MLGGCDSRCVGGEAYGVWFESTLLVNHQLWHVRKRAAMVQDKQTDAHNARDRLQEWPGRLLQQGCDLLIGIAM